MTINACNSPTPQSLALSPRPSQMEKQRPRSNRQHTPTIQTEVHSNHQSRTSMRRDQDHESKRSPTHRRRRSIRARPSSKTSQDEESGRSAQTASKISRHSNANTSHRSQPSMGGRTSLLSVKESTLGRFTQTGIPQRSRRNPT